MIPADATAFTQRLYAELRAYTHGDAANGYPLLTLIESFGHLAQQVDDYARDTDEGPGWSNLIDGTRAPADALGYLGQFVGVEPPRLLDGETDEEYAERFRSLILAPLGFIRGTPAALRLVAQQHLTGTKQVYFYERDGGNAYQLRIHTRAAETPDPDAVERALISQKPAGIVLTYSTIVGGDYDTLLGAHADYDEVEADFTDYDDIVSDPSQT